MTKEETKDNLSLKELVFKMIEHGSSNVDVILSKDDFEITVDVLIKKVEVSGTAVFEDSREVDE